MNFRLLVLALLAMLCIGASSAFAQTRPDPPTSTTPECRMDCGGDGGGGYEAGEPFCPFTSCGRPDPEPDPDPRGDCELAPCTTPDPCVGSDCTPPTSCVGAGCGPVADCQVNCGPGSGSNIPGNKAGLKLCDAQIGELKQVTARQIKGINGRDTVQVVPVCVDKNLIEQQQGVENLRSAIAGNGKMGAALGQQGYSAEHVVGVVIGRTQAVLYVHAL